MLAGLIDIDAIPRIAPIAPIAPPALTGLIGWWDASVTASLTLSGAFVTAIADQSGAGNHLTNVGTPTYDAANFNSRPGIRYDSTEGDGLIKSSLALGTGSTLTLFVAMFMNDPAVSGMGQPAWIFGYTASGAAHDYDNVGSFALVRDQNDANVKFFRNSVTSAARTLGYATNRRVIVTVKSDGTWTTYVDGVAVADAKTANNWVSPGYFGLGISQNDSSIFSQLGGTIAEAGIATGYHDATTVAGLDSYLKTKWGL